MVYYWEIFPNCPLGKKPFFPLLRSSQFEPFVFYFSGFIISMLEDLLFLSFFYFLSFSFGSVVLWSTQLCSSFFFVLSFRGSFFSLFLLGSFFLLSYFFLLYFSCPRHHSYRNQSFKRNDLKDQIIPKFQGILLILFVL